MQHACEINSLNCLLANSIALCSTYAGWGFSLTFADVTWDAALASGQLYKQTNANANWKHETVFRIYCWIWLLLCSALLLSSLLIMHDKRNKKNFTASSYHCQNCQNRRRLKTISDARTKRDDWKASLLAKNKMKGMKGDRKQQLVALQVVKEMLICCCCVTMMQCM